MRKHILRVCAFVIFAMCITACENKVSQVEVSPASEFSHEEEAAQRGYIYLYGEAHGVKRIMDEELRLWQEYYDNEGMRHLFMEYAYYHGELLNLWIKADTDEILEEMFEDWVGTQAYNEYTLEHFRHIKANCPETVFHGTDVGHQYNTAGERYLKYLEDNNLKDSPEYALTLEAIEQGKKYYNESNNRYRENAMAENFIREFDKLNGESVMGIYGSDHTGLDAMGYKVNIPSMANQLKTHYGDIVYSTDLSDFEYALEPIRTDTINFNGKDYEASYFGKVDISSWSDKYMEREFWRLENAYSDFKDMEKTGYVLPFNNYPMKVEDCQVFVIDYTSVNGLVERQYFISDGLIWQDMPTTEEVVLKAAKP